MRYDEIQQCLHIVDEERQPIIAQVKNATLLDA